MLDAVAELGEHLFGDVGRILRNKIDADALRADEADDLLDLIDEGLRRVRKQQMGFVKKENELWLIEIAGLGQRLKKFT